MFLKKLLVCLLIVFCFCFITPLTGFAKDDETFSPEEVRTYLNPVGTTDGYEVYLRPEDYKTQLETAVLEESQRKELKKKLRNTELVLMDSVSGTVSAELEEIAKNQEQHIYFSKSGEYLVILNAQQKQVLKIRYRVSVLDSAYLFLTQDKQTLELYSTDYLSVRAEMPFVRSDGKETLFQTKDGQQWAVLENDCSQVQSCVRKIAENEKLVFYYDEDSGLIGLENKKTSYIWWSSPVGASHDDRATPLIISELQSPQCLTYGDRNHRGTTNLRSRQDADLQVKETENGLTISYSYDKCGITVPVSYELKEDYLAVSVECDEIQETMSEKGLIATQLTLLGAFGAGTKEEEGYFVIPDGCGALIYFHNGKETAKNYAQKVYGRDLTNVPDTKPAVTEKITMPVYGIVKKKNALAVIIEKGDGNATLNASVTGQSLSSFNLCSFSFQLRGSDTYSMAGDYGNLTVFEDGAIQTDSIKLRYYPIANEKANYVGIAETYRNYLLDNGNLQKKTQPQQAELFLDFYGGTMKERSVLGIPFLCKTSATSYTEAKEILSGLKDSGADNISVIYHQWTDDGISGKIDFRAKPASVLGGAKSFQQLTDYLTEQQFSFYPCVNNQTFLSGNGYHTFTDTAIRISSAYSRQMEYTLANGIQDTSQDTKALLSPAFFPTLYQNLAMNYTKQNLTGVALSDITSALWGDYGNQHLCRDDSMQLFQISCQELQKANISVLADSCCAYLFPYTDKISHVPLYSSGFDIFDEDIPFYQLVMHGILPCSSTAVNASADPTDTFLNAVATGCFPSYDMIHAQASDLQETDLNLYYYANADFWTDVISKEYPIVKEILAPISDKLMTDYTRKGDISTTTFEDGSQIVVNYAEDTITANGIVYTLKTTEKGTNP